MVDVNQTSCSEMKKPVKQLHPPQPLVTLPLICSGINSKIDSKWGTRETSEKQKDASISGGGMCRGEDTGRLAGFTALHKVSQKHGNISPDMGMERKDRDAGDK